MRRNVFNKLACLVAMFLAVAFASLNSGLRASALTVIDIDANKYGYGKYLIKAKGTNYEGVYDEDSTYFYYLPVFASIAQSKEDGKYYMHLEYIIPEDLENLTDDDIASIKIEIYEKGSKEQIKYVSPIMVTPPTQEVNIPFGECAKDADGACINGENGKPIFPLEDGNYIFKIYAYNKDGKLFYDPFELPYTYDSGVEIPDTGSPLRIPNIVRTDYLVTGLVAFSIVAICGLFIITRGNKQKATRNVKRSAYSKASSRTRLTSRARSNSRVNSKKRR